jgi:histidinol-phosphate aminotransferase
MTDQIKAVPGVAGLQPYIPGKPVEELEREYGVSNAVKVASNENPLGPAPSVIAQLKKLLDNPVELSRYPDGNGFVLKNRLTEKLSTGTATIEQQQITLGNGSNDVLDIIARTFASSGDEVIFSQYAFAVYPIATKAVGANAVITPAKDWGHDLQAMLDAITAKTKLIFIANPNNPTGTYLPKAELEQFLLQVPANIAVVIDEAYEEYASHPASGISEHYGSLISAINQFPNLIITRTFSKAYGLASFRIGYSISSAGIADLLNRVRHPFNNNSLALQAAAVALDAAEHLESGVTLNWQGMKYLTQQFDQAGWQFIPSAGNFVCLQTGPDTAGIYERLLHEGVITRPIANYQMPEHLRISIGTMDENQRVMTALEKILNQP